MPKQEKIYYYKSQLTSELFPYEGPNTTRRQTELAGKLGVHVHGAVLNEIERRWGIGKAKTNTQEARHKRGIQRSIAKAAKQSSNRTSLLIWSLVPAR